MFYVFKDALFTLEDGLYSTGGQSYTFISAVLSVNLFSFVRESYTYKLQHLQFGAAKCRLPAAPHFYIFRGLKRINLSAFYVSRSHRSTHLLRIE